MAYSKGDLLKFSLDDSQKVVRKKLENQELVSMNLINDKILIGNN